MGTKSIETVAIIGLGALGVNFAHCLAKGMKKENLRIVADKDRIKRYKDEGIFYNAKECEFTFVENTMEMKPADLVIFCTKFNGLESAMKSMKHQIKEHTIIMSALNGISSEEILSNMYRREHILYTVAQGMDATKVDNHVTCHTIGELCFGESKYVNSSTVEKVAQFFTSVAFPFHIKEDIISHQWSKFMLNVGLNQVLAIHKGTYRLVQENEEVRNEMINAMREVMQLASYAGIQLNETHMNQWLAMISTLSADGMPSMAQDVLALRYSEVELFSGTMLKLANLYGVDVPINKGLYETIKEMEATYERG